MEPQTDGPEWVLAALFVLGFVVVIGAAIREFSKLRKGDGDDPESKR